MVEWLAGNRIRGTSTERTVGTSEVPAVVTQGGWKELGRTTLGSTGDTISVTSLPDKRHYMVLNSIIPSGSVSPRRRLNNDSGSNYSARTSGNGSSDATNTSISYFNTYTNYSNPYFQIDNIANISNKEKLNISQLVDQNSAGAGTAPQREEGTNKWANTSASINRYDSVNTEGGDYNTGSEVVVLGWDPTDTHTINFWEELASVELGSASDTLDAGTISAKKYLWVQTYIKAVSGTAEPDMRFNNDSGSNYADRYSINGGSDGTGTSITSARGSGVPVSAFFNDFIINNASNEKLVIRHVTYVSTAGAGTAPNRRETVAKWSNTSDSITSIKWVENSGGAGQFDTGSFIKVWGSD